jgi:hypothetical protein
VITLIVYGAMLPVINSVISDTLPYADAWTQLILNAIPLIMLLMIIVGMLQQNQQNQYIQT